MERFLRVRPSHLPRRARTRHKRVVRVQQRPAPLKQQRDSRTQKQSAIAVENPIMLRFYHFFHDNKKTWPSDMCIPGQGHAKQALLRHRRTGVVLLCPQRICRRRRCVYHLRHSHARVSRHERYGRGFWRTNQSQKRMGYFNSSHQQRRFCPPLHSIGASVPEWRLLCRRRSSDVCLRSRRGLEPCRKSLQQFSAACSVFVFWVSALFGRVI